MVADLMETCIDDVIGSPVVPTVMATEEAGPSDAYASASASASASVGVTADDPLSLAGEDIENLPSVKIKFTQIKKWMNKNQFEKM